MLGHDFFYSTAKAGKDEHATAKGTLGVVTSKYAEMCVSIALEPLFGPALSAALPQIKGRVFGRLKVSWGVTFLHGNTLHVSKYKRKPISPFACSTVFIVFDKSTFRP